jgi:hypothetical protein
VQKTFLLGLGAQKAGTTWVHQYLRGHPDCAFGAIKEMASLNIHFDGNIGGRRRVNKINALRDALEQAASDIGDGELPEERMLQLLGKMDHVAADLGLDHYLRYFSTQFEQNPDAVLTGDITPGYCMMSQSALKQTKSRLEDTGYRVKALFLMRDPVERCFSALRMAYRRSHKDGADFRNTGQRLR